MTRNAALATALACAALAGCVTLFPKEAPTPLYRFGENVPAASVAGPGFTVRLATIAFDEAAASDAIMTVSGDEVAYISGGRWAAPAPDMFDATVHRGFAGGSVRLLAPGEPGQAVYTMRLSVTRFEARYGHGPTTAPTVEVTVRATMTRTADQSLVASKEFDVSQPAAANRIGAIADAFDQATDQAISQLAAWAQETGTNAAAASAPS